MINFLAALKQHADTFAEGEAVALPSVLVSHRYPGLRLRYWAIHPDGRLLYLDEVVPFTYTETQFGGQRQWLKCLCCSRRVRVLYGGKKNLFRCRKCYGLAYRSTRLNWFDRADTQADKLALKICGGDRELYDGDEFQDKPPRMRWTTYWRLEEQFYQWKDMWAVGLMQKLGIGLIECRVDRNERRAQVKEVVGLIPKRVAAFRAEGRYPGGPGQGRRPLN